MGWRCDASAARPVGKDALQLPGASQHAGTGLEEQVRRNGVDLLVLHGADRGKAGARLNGGGIDGPPAPTGQDDLGVRLDNLLRLDDAFTGSAPAPGGKEIVAAA